MNNFDQKAQADRSANGVSTNLGNWYQRNVLDKSTNDTSPNDPTGRYMMERQFSEQEPKPQLA